MKLSILSLLGVLFTVTACADVPPAVVEAQSLEQSSQGEPSEVEVSSLVYQASCGEGPVKNPTEMFVSVTEQGPLYLSVHFETGDGAGIDDALLELYFENSQGVYSLNETEDFNRPVWIYVGLTDGEEADVNKLSEYFSNNRVRSMFILNTKESFSLESFLNEALSTQESGVASDLDSLIGFSDIEMSLMHNEDHPHYPSCENIQYLDEVQNYTFNFETGHEHEGHDHEGHDHDHN